MKWVGPSVAVGLLFLVVIVAGLYEAHLGGHLKLPDWAALYAASSQQSSNTRPAAACDEACQRAAFGRYADFSIAGVRIRSTDTLLLLFALVFAAALVIQGRSMARKIDELRADFISVYRPKIAVRNFETDFSVPTKTAIVRFNYVNMGDMPATLIEIGIKVVIAGQLPSSIAFDRRQMSGMKLLCGEKALFSTESKDLFSMRVVHQLSSPGTMPQTAFCVGYVIYEDDRQRRREMGFCRGTDGAGDRWTLMPGSEYEYAD